MVISGDQWWSMVIHVSHDIPNSSYLSKKVRKNPHDLASRTANQCQPQKTHEFSINLTT